jgi:hypothetical protein
VTEGLPPIRFREFPLYLIHQVEQFPRLPGTVAPGKLEGAEDSASGKDRDGLVHDRVGRR